MEVDLRELQENQWVSEIRIDKLEFIVLLFDISSNTVLAFQLAKPSSSI